MNNQSSVLFHVFYDNNEKEWSVQYDSENVPDDQIKKKTILENFKQWIIDSLDEDQLAVNK